MAVKQLARKRALCFLCCEKKAMAVVFNMYTGWSKNMCVECSNLYTAFQANYMFVPLDSSVRITERNGYWCVELK